MFDRISYCVLQFCIFCSLSIIISRTYKNFLSPNRKELQISNLEVITALIRDSVSDTDMDNSLF